MLNIFPQRVFDRKEVFEPTVFHPQEPSVLNIFPQRIFDTNTLFRSSSYQKPGLPAYLHQAAAVPTNQCLHQAASAAQAFNNQQFCITVAKCPRLAWPRQHLFGCCWEQLLLLTTVGRWCTFKSKFFLHPTPLPLSTLHQLRAERRYRIASARALYNVAWLYAHPGLSAITPAQPNITRVLRTPALCSIIT